VFDLEVGDEGALRIDDDDIVMVAGRHHGVVLLRELREPAFYQTLGWWPAHGPVSFAEHS
jgi:hypothetical protein